jgi:hypothetical protein
MPKKRRAKEKPGERSPYAATERDRPQQTPQGESREDSDDEFVTDAEIEARERNRRLKG